MKVVVTGKGGQLASEFKALKGFDSNWTFLSEKDLDITNKTSVLSYFKSNTFDVVINCAAYTAVDKAEDEFELAFKVNGEEYRDKNFTGRDYCEQKGIEIYYNSRDHRFSSSGLRNQVKEAELRKIK